MNERLIKLREYEFKKNGFTKVVNLDAKFWFCLFYFSFMEFVLFYLASSIIQHTGFGLFWVVVYIVLFGVIIYLFSSLFINTYFKPLIDFHWQMKKWFNSSEVKQFFVFCSAEYGFKPMSLDKQDFQNLKLFLRFLKEENAVFIRPMPESEKLKQIVQAEILFLKNLLEAENTCTQADINRINSESVEKQIQTEDEIWELKKFENPEDPGT
jgi:hypothetical protein